jgi:hypothetical protein
MLCFRLHPGIALASCPLTPLAITAVSNSCCLRRWVCACVKLPPLAAPQSLPGGPPAAVVDLTAWTLVSAPATSPTQHACICCVGVANITSYLTIQRVTVQCSPVLTPPNRTNAASGSAALPALLKAW